MAADEAVQHDAGAPNVGLGAHVLETLNELRRSIAGRAARCDELLVGLERVAESEVDNLKILLLVE